MLFKGVIWDIVIHLGQGQTLSIHFSETAGLVLWSETVVIKGSAVLQVNIVGPFT